MEAAAQRVADELGSADILLNNAGQMLLSPFTPEQAEETRRMVETNLLGAMTTLEVFLEQLPRRAGRPGEHLLGRGLGPRSRGSVGLQRDQVGAQRLGREALRQELKDDGHPA